MVNLTLTMQKKESHDNCIYVQAIIINSSLSTVDRKPSKKIQYGFFNAD